MIEAQLSRMATDERVSGHGLNKLKLRTKTSRMDKRHESHDKTMQVRDDKKFAWKISAICIFSAFLFDGYLRTSVMAELQFVDTIQRRIVSKYITS